MRSFKSATFVVMVFRNITLCYLICVFLIGSSILPLGDFSLANDLPKMYQSYTKLANPEEVGIIDFVGDYLFAGKVLLGHNKKDKSENASTSIQFQHAPTGFNLVYGRVETICIFIKDFKITHNQLKNPIETTGFHPELFRPPLV